MTTPKRLFIITGDASGDTHASHVIRHLQTIMPQLEIQAIGGQHIQATDTPLFHNQQAMGVLGMGVLGALPSHFLLGKKLLKHFDTWRPDAVLLIDYGVFNLWMAGHLKRRGIPVYYYIPPQVWASRRWRLKKIKRFVDHVFCIFPFEKPLYDSHNIPATFVGHPLVEQLPPPPDREAFCREHGLDPDLPIIGLFPGSRRSEIKGLLADMIRSIPLIEAQSGQRHQYLLALSPAVSQEFFNQQFTPVQSIAQQVPFHILTGSNHAILALSHAALVASGTVTLEAALYRTPVVISYRISPLAYFFFKRFSYVQHIGLPNLLSDLPEGFLPELMTERVTPEAFAQSILPFLSNTEQRLLAESQFEGIRRKLGIQPASVNVAQTLATMVNIGTGETQPPFTDIARRDEVTSARLLS